MRVSPALRPCCSRESWLRVPESTVGRAGAGLVDGCEGAGLVDGWGAGRVDGCGWAGRVSGFAGSTGFHWPRSFVSQLPGLPGLGRYTFPSGPA